MNRSLLRLLMAMMMLVAVFALAACGDDEESSSTDTPAAQSEDQSDAIEGGQKGGKLTQLGGTDVDFLDPGKSYYTAGFQVIYAMHRTLYSFEPEDSSNPVPDLAESEPEISEDAKTVTVKIRKGVKYGPPVDREVVADDVKYAIERGFSENVQNQYPGYFAPIVGAPEPYSKGVKPISGITTPDDYTIVFKLKEPVGVSFAAALVMPITAPVPRDFAEKHDAKTPSTYNNHVVATGPYMIENNAEGKLVGYKAAKSISMVRNPNWDGEATGDYRPAYLDEIFLRTNATDTDVASRQVLEGESSILDTNPSANILKRVVTQTKDQYVSVPSGGYRYFPMNTTVKPFDDINVRRAVMAGFNRNAAVLARGGKYVGDVATHFLPPEFPGFEEAGGAEGPAPEYFTLEGAGGDMEMAAEYFKKAGYASGKYEGDEELLVVGANVDPGKAQAEVVQGELEKMGFKVRLRLVPQDAVYTEWCQVPGKNVAMCAGAGWFKDFADPQSMLEPTFKGPGEGKEFPKTGNINYSEINDPAINKAMDEAALAEGDERLQAWADVDKMIVESAAAIPFIWDKTTLIRSKNVNGVAASYYTSWDLNFTSIKQ